MKLGFSSQEISFLDRRSMNPADAMLALTAQRGSLSVGELYDMLVECKLPMIADLL